ncbi:MAG: HAMP domain-containing sensor histidine kinase [Campylobacterota bacterium]
MRNLFKRLISALTKNHTFTSNEWILKYKIEILIIIIMLVSVIIMMFSFIRLLEGNYLLAAIDAGFASFVLILLYFLHKDKDYYSVISRLFLFFGVIVMFANFYLATDTYTRVLWFSSYMLLAFFLRDKKEGFVWLAIIITILSIVAVTEPQFDLDTVNYMTLIANLILIATIVYWYEKVKENDRERLRAMNATLQVRIDKAVIENQKHERMLIQQSKMAAMGEMIESIAHQWRQPLNVMSLSLTKLDMEHNLDILDDKSFDAQVTTMNRQVQYMSQTIDDFRSFYQKDKHAIDVSLQEMIDDIEALITPLLRSKSIDFKNETDQDIRITTYPNEFKQVLLNLVNNAKDALMSCESDIKEIIIRADEEERTITIQVIDNAKGIDEKIIDRIFEPYFTTKFEAKGTGIGLYMSKIIIEDHMHGNISAENRENGAQFVIRLPKTLPTVTSE